MIWNSVTHPLRSTKKFKFQNMENKQSASPENKISSLRRQIMALDQKLGSGYSSPKPKVPLAERRRPNRSPSFSSPEEDAEEQVILPQAKPGQKRRPAAAKGRTASRAAIRGRSNSITGRKENSLLSKTSWDPRRERSFVQDRQKPLASPRSVEKKYAESKQLAQKLELELFSEKQRNRELRQRVKQCDQKQQVDEKTMAEIRKLKDDYEVLVKSFKCSEQIRQKQKEIIKQLTAELEKRKKGGAAKKPRVPTKTSKK